MKQSVGFIGGGRVTRILLQGFKNKKVNFGKVVVADTDADVLENLKKHFPEVEVADVKTAARQEIVFISLHPPVVMGALDLMKGEVRSGATVISLAPKINIARISSALPGITNIGRMIPNATSFINEGYNPVCLSPAFDPAKRKVTLDFLNLLGTTFEVAEEKLESYAIMSAMLPTYFWFQLNELSAIGEKTGLSEMESKQSINETLVASMNLLYRSGLTPGEVIDLIPVKPIGEFEPQIIEMYRSRLVPLFEKIKP